MSTGMSLSKAKEVTLEANEELKAFKQPVNALTLQKALEKALRPIVSTLQEIYEIITAPEDDEEGEVCEEADEEPPVPPKKKLQKE